MITKTVDIGGNQTVVDADGNPVRKVATYYGLSTDVKPAAQDADVFIEKDTMRAFIYDAERADWFELKNN